MARPNLFQYPAYHISIFDLHPIPLFNVTFDLIFIDLAFNCYFYILRPLNYIPIPVLDGLFLYLGKYLSILYTNLILFIYLSTYPSINIYIYLSIYLSKYPLCIFIFKHIYLSICLSIYLSSCDSSVWKSNVWKITAPVHGADCVSSKPLH